MMRAFIAVFSFINYNIIAAFFNTSFYFHLRKYFWNIYKVPSVLCLCCQSVSKFLCGESVSTSCICVFILITYQEVPIITSSSITS